MSVERGSGSVVEGQAAMLREYRFATPDEEVGRALAMDLAGRGHRWVRVRPMYLPHLDPENRLFGKPEFSRPELEGWWQVSSVVDELAVDGDAENHQRVCEEVEVAAIVRSRGGFYEGGSIAHRETLLRHLNLDGLLFDVEQEQAYERRASVVETLPAPRNISKPLAPAASATSDGLPPLLDTVRAVARQLQADGVATPVTSWWLADDAAGFEDDREVLFELSDAVLHQGTCSPHTAEQIPLLAGLIEHEGIAPVSRAFLLLLLAEAGSVGRRIAAQDADRRRALGLGFAQGPEETAAQGAVDAVAPRLLRRWPEECEVVRCALAFLAAVCPGSGHTSGISQAIAEMASATPERHRATMLRLAQALASGEAATLDHVYAAAIDSTPIELTRVPSPAAPANCAGLDVLHRMLELEMSLVLGGDT